jgi:hypothetical protein
MYKEDIDKQYLIGQIEAINSFLSSMPMSRGDVGISHVGLDLILDIISETPDNVIGEHVANIDAGWYGLEEDEEEEEE